MTETTSSSTGSPLARLRPIGLSPRSASSEPRPKQLSTRRARPLSRLEPLPQATRLTLDFDVETVAAGYADPAWVPSHVTAWAYSWTHQKKIHSAVLPVAQLFDREAKAEFIRPLLDALRAADVVTGHNIRRFDLPILLTESMRLPGLERLGPTLSQDTIKVGRTKGFKKGLDNLAELLETMTAKKALNWEQWDRAYGEGDLKTVRQRVRGDVKMHKEVRLQMRERGWLEAPRIWRP